MQWKRVVVTGDSATWCSFNKFSRWFFRSHALFMNRAAFLSYIFHTSFFPFLLHHLLHIHLGLSILDRYRLNPVERAHATVTWPDILFTPRRLHASQRALHSQLTWSSTDVVFRPTGSQILDYDVIGANGTNIRSVSDRVWPKFDVDGIKKYDVNWTSVKHANVT